MVKVGTNYHCSLKVLSNLGLFLAETTRIRSAGKIANSHAQNLLKDKTEVDLASDLLLIAVDLICFCFVFLLTVAFIKYHYRF